MNDATNDRPEGRNPEQGSESSESAADQRRLIRQLLIAEAVKSGKRAEQRVQILDRVQQLGGPLALDELFSLQTLLRHRSAAVRQKAEAVIMAASPCGLPDDPKIAALMRMLNPLLRVVPARRPPRRTRLSDYAAALRGDRAAARRRARSSAAWQRREERELRRRS